MQTHRPIRVVLIGWGAIARRAAALLADDDAVRIAAVAVRDRSRARSALPVGARLIADPADLHPATADIVVEAAGVDAVPVWAHAALRAAPRLVIASTAALTDDALRTRLIGLACELDGQIILPSGALAGIDALAAAGALDLTHVTHTIAKPPAAWRGTEAETLCALDTLRVAHEFCHGTAREIAARFPKNANVAVISALAGIGLDRTLIRLVADPDLRCNMHHIVAEGAFGRMETRVENAALADNPKSSELTALSLVAAIRRESLRLVV